MNNRSSAATAANVEVPVARVPVPPLKDITIGGHNRSGYTWPLIAVYLICAPLVRWEYMTETTYGVIWISCLMVILSALSKDFNRNATFIIVVLLVALFLGLGWFGREFDEPILTNIGGWFQKLDIPGPRDMALLVAGGCTLGILWDKGRSRLNDYWRIRKMQVEHIVDGQSDTSFPCINTTVTTSYPDMARGLILLAGDITFRNPSQKEKRIIKNVPLCPFVARRIRRRFDALSTVDQSASVVTQS